MNKLVLVVLLICLQGTVSARLSGCDGTYWFASPTSGKIIKCNSARQCAKKHARASSYWQRISSSEKEKIIVKLKKVLTVNGLDVKYSSVTKQYINGQLIDKFSGSSEVRLSCGDSGF